jgi:hypothetical protein
MVYTVADAVVLKTGLVDFDESAVRGKRESFGFWKLKQQLSVTAIKG